jgi:A-macroglobulin TED domain
VNVKQVDALRYNAGKTNAIQYLASQLFAASADPYALSIICYTLTLANNSLADNALQLLNSLAINKGSNTPLDSYTSICFDLFINSYSSASVCQI